MMVSVENRFGGNMLRLDGFFFFGCEVGVLLRNDYGKIKACILGRLKLNNDAWLDPIVAAHESLYERCVFQKVEAITCLNFFCFYFCKLRFIIHDMNSPSDFNRASGPLGQTGDFTT